MLRMSLTAALLALTLVGCRRDPADPIHTDLPEVIGTWSGSSESGSQMASVTAHFGHELSHPSIDGNGVLRFSLNGEPMRTRVFQLTGVVAGNRVAFTTQRHVSDPPGQAVLADHFEGTLVHRDTIAGTLSLLAGIQCNEACEYVYVATTMRLGRELQGP